ncbi:HAD family hydrolase [Ensifer adhaerens]|uniref:HAD family hydrolase n=1 Tax=Ensifer adhaerens TaxID=106592 RepID=UPI000CF06171|nr:HAD family hydrolase [Ensifer adhaerens]
MEKAAIFFDLYHTLVEEQPDNPFYSRIIASLGLEASSFLPAYKSCGDATMRGVLDGMGGRIAEACRLSNQMRSREQIAASVASCLPIFHAAVIPYPDLAKSLDRIEAAGVPMAIISNASQYSVAVIEELGLFERMDAVVLSFEERILKPEPSIYRTALKRVGACPSSSVFVGDGGNDELAGARHCGLHTILIDRRLTHTERAREYADLVVPSLSAASEAALSLIETSCSSAT